MIRVPKSVLESAERVASDAVAQVIEAIRSERMQIHDNPVYWYHYHRYVLEAMPPRRRRVAWWHKKRCRNAHAAMRASRYLAKACKEASQPCAV